MESKRRGVTTYKPLDTHPTNDHSRGIFNEQLDAEMENVMFGFSIFCGQVMNRLILGEISVEEMRYLIDRKESEIHKEESRELQDSQELSAFLDSFQRKGSDADGG